MSKYNAWFKDYSWESLIDIEEDIQYCDVIPDGEFEGVIRVTVEYFPDA